MSRNSTAVNHGYEPQSKLWKHFAASCGVLYHRLYGIIRLTNFYSLRPASASLASLLKFESHYPPLHPADGGIQLTNSDALRPARVTFRLSAGLRFRNWSFTNKEGFTFIEVIITLVVAAILAALFVTFMGTNLTGSPIPAVRAQNHYALIGVVEQMNIDYNKLMNAGDPDVLGTLRSHIQNGNVVANVPYFGQYTQVTKFITFDPATHIEQAAETLGSNTLKVTITRVDQTITTLFTK